MHSGLSSIQARDYLEKYGLNKLPDKSTSTTVQLIFNQFKNLLTLLLLSAALIAFLIGDRIDSILILTILILNTGLGFWQEYKASKELQALRKLEISTTRVIRDGIEAKIPSYELVPGDIVLLESGDKIPADGSLLESYELSVNESALTGESLPVTKTTAREDNSVYFGTVVVSGRAKMQITATGQNTRFGKIALTLSTVEEEPTPLEQSLNTLAKRVGFLAILAALAIFVIGLLHSEPIREVFFSSVALMVAIVPEGLPTIITVLLALGVRKMYHRKTLVRKMSAIESLGATNIICTDKTGTLTKNQMSVKTIILNKENDKAEAIKAGVICNSASLVITEDHGSVDILGDTTEGALLIWAGENGIDIDQVRNSGKIIEEIPFNLQRRMMSVLWQEGDKRSLYSKGAPEVVLPLCSLSEDKLQKLTDTYKQLASKGLRILAIASKKDLHQHGNSAIVEKDLEFLGLVGIADAPRVEAAQAISKARQAGIEVVMITGDNELTAKAIAEEVGLLKEGDEVMSGDQLSQLTDEELTEKISRIRVFARVVPEHKLRIVQAFQSFGKVVAVPGDGVNDALALKQAHIGVAMGTTGTDVAKEAADIIILDDNLSTIISAVEEGRVIYSNIIKIVKFLLAGNLSEVLLILGSVLVGYPTPLLPVQILWINFVTDGLPALSLAADPASRNVMSTPPRDRSQSLLNSANLKYIAVSGLIIGCINFLIFISFFHLYDLQVARNIVFSTTILSQLIFIFILRKHHSITSNKYLLGSVGLLLIVQFAILSFPPLQEVFKIK